MFTWKEDLIWINHWQERTSVSLLRKQKQERKELPLPGLKLRRASAGICCCCRHVVRITNNKICSCTFKVVRFSIYLRGLVWIRTLCLTYYHMRCKEMTYQHLNTSVYLQKHFAHDAEEEILQKLQKKEDLKLSLSHTLDSHCYTLSMQH